MTKVPNRYIENIGCPSCGSSDAVGVYERPDGSHFGKCFKCETIHADPYSTNETSEVTNKESKIVHRKATFLETNSSVNALATRGISKETCEKYGIRSILNANGIDVAHFYPATREGSHVASLLREVADKNFFWSGDTKSGPLEFFGQREAGEGGRMIIITEGVCDMLASVEMLKKMGKNYRVVSLLNGASAAVQDFKNNFEWINTFDNIFLAFDQDAPGQSKVEEIASMFPTGKVKNVSFSEKDPNALLLSGKHNEFYQAIFNSKGIKVEGIVSVKDILKKALEPDPPSVPYPWPALNDLLLGYRRKELIVIGASPGAGKTQFCKEIIHHTINFTGLPVGLVFLEEAPSYTAKAIASLSANKRFTLPRSKGNWTDEELAKELGKLEDKIYFFDHFGAKSFEEIKAKIAYMANSLGIKDIFIDHITALVAAEPDEYKALNKLSEELASMAYDLDITIFLVSHLRKSSTGKSFSEGAQISTDSFRGSGSLISWSHLIFALSRDQSSDDEVVRNTTTLSILKSRFIGEAVGCKIQLYYDKETGRMTEYDGESLNPFEDEEFD
jgi:twinkle protein